VWRDEFRRGGELGRRREFGFTDAERRKTNPPHLSLSPPLLSGLRAKPAL